MGRSPRRCTTSRSGNRARRNARHRTLDAPIRLPRGNSSSGVASSSRVRTSTSRGSSRTGIAPMTNPGTASVDTSHNAWTASSTFPLTNACSSSLVKIVFALVGAIVSSCFLSLAVRKVTSSDSTPRSISIAWTTRARRSASSEARVAMRSTTVTSEGVVPATTARARTPRRARPQPRTPRGNRTRYRASCFHGCLAHDRQAEARADKRRAEEQEREHRDHEGGEHLGRQRGPVRLEHDRGRMQGAEQVDAQVNERDEQRGEYAEHRRVPRPHHGLVDRAAQDEICRRQKPEKERQGEPRVPCPPGTPDRLAPQGSGGQDHRREEQADFARALCEPV